MSTPADTSAQIFGKIYDDEVWQGGGSGPGSDPFVARPWVDLVAHMILDKSIHSVVDAGCGDWRMWPHDAFADVQYLGVDAVASVIEKNTIIHGAPKRRFVVGDLLTLDLPPADMLITKDVWQHWTNDQVCRFLDANAGKYRVIVAANDIRLRHLRHRARAAAQGRRLNAQGKLGDWRPVDLTRSPFDRFGFALATRFAAGLYVKAVYVRDR